jgi:hypothetical protein
MNDEWICASDARSIALGSYPKAGDAELSILRLAKDGRVRARADEFRIGAPARLPLPSGSEIPSNFWAALIEAGCGGRWAKAEPDVRWQDWQLGCFAISIEGEAYEATGVTFAHTDLLKSLPKPIRQTLSRAPSVKSGRPPGDKLILKKADEMKGRGMSGRSIASQMRSEPGFENVATTSVRDLIKGRYAPGRPKQANQ